MKNVSKILTVSPVVFALLVSMAQAQNTVSTQTKGTGSSESLSTLQKETETSDRKPPKEIKNINSLENPERGLSGIKKSNKNKDQQKSKKGFTGSGPEMSRDNADD